MSRDICPVCDEQYCRCPPCLGCEELRYKLEKAIDLAISFGEIDGAHHKDWVIDQIVRILAGDKYTKIIKDACNGEDGPDTYEWSCGIAP